MSIEQFIIRSSHSTIIRHKIPLMVLTVNCTMVTFPNSLVFSSSQFLWLSYSGLSLLALPLPPPLPSSHASRDVKSTNVLFLMPFLLLPFSLQPGYWKREEGRWRNQVGLAFTPRQMCNPSCNWRKWCNWCWLESYFFFLCLQLNHWQWKLSPKHLTYPLAGKLK